MHTGAAAKSKYKLQTIRDNVALLTPEVLDEINRFVVNAGHNLVKKNSEANLNGRCDSFVVETNVHYPTDINLLLDAIRKVIQSMAQVCFTYAAYVEVVESFVFRAKDTVLQLSQQGCSAVITLLVIDGYIQHAERQIDQVRRRVLNDEVIPHDEKVFSIFEQHTEWICKGKAGVPQELGLKVCVLEDQYGFLLHHRVMEKQSDEQVAFAMVIESKKRFADLGSCSFYSPANRQKLADVLDKVVLPKKGKLSLKEKEIECSEEFIQARHHHSAIESAINAVENHGLDRCLDKGIDGFKRYVALAIVARNLQMLGHIIQQKKLERLKKRRLALAA